VQQHGAAECGPTQRSEARRWPRAEISLGGVKTVKEKAVGVGVEAVPSGQFREDAGQRLPQHACEEFARQGIVPVQGGDQVSRRGVSRWSRRRPSWSVAAQVPLRRAL
jgi:hypothetical protein